MHAAKWKMVEFTLTTKDNFDNPFWDVQLQAQFVHQSSGTAQTVHGYYDGLSEDGAHVWKVRWTPVQEGEWSCATSVYPSVPDLTRSYEIQVGAAPEQSRGYLRANPDLNYGFQFDNGEPFFLFGDTQYNLFAAHYCGVDVESILHQRRKQGINYIRARLQVSPYHPDTPNQWQTKDCWPWGGSAQMPNFMKVNLAYFRAVDEVVAQCEELGIGLEMILQAWLFEFPFNDRGKFVAEYELFWNRYVIARYAASTAVYIWCPANEYEFYPTGTPGKYHKESNRWMKRLSDQIRQDDAFAHPIGAHNWEKTIPMPQRLGDCGNIEVYLVQTSWGVETKGFTRDASLCKGLEKDMRVHSGNKNVVSVCAEFGYERASGLLTARSHQSMDHHHTRRGQWRAGFSGYTVVHGFDNTWGAHMTLDSEPQGTAYLSSYYRFMTETLSFQNMKPAPELVELAIGSEEEGTLPICLSDRQDQVISVYFPTPGECTLKLNPGQQYSYRWFNPRTGIFADGGIVSSERFVTPEQEENVPGGADSVLYITAAEKMEEREL
ncbi:DUF4038 domain-containing protein [Paenibacillus thalictri]|uniref:DUF4038 domain-containing protein n=1 Tax=Paenibacillus thalictri TaxID=2527873 RepID=A0A4Q9DFR8_9BACL|nr:DUF4038 domain-containing protein [Paenibacillus thalictri]TBL70319.1 DUF4038 domain-containing protein [Paenibacillus thalictri]